MKVSEMEARGSKALLSAEPLKEPGWLAWILMKSIRTAVLTVMWSGLGMGVGLFCGISGVLVASAIQHHSADMSAAYRHIAVPVAILTGGCALLWNLLRVVQAARKRITQPTSQRSAR